MLSDHTPLEYTGAGLSKKLEKYILAHSQYIEVLSELIKRFFPVRGSILILNQEESEFFVAKSSQNE